MLKAAVFGTVTRMKNYWHVVPVLAEWQLEKPLVTKLLDTPKQILWNYLWNYYNSMYAKCLCGIGLERKKKNKNGRLGLALLPFCTTLVIWRDYKVCLWGIW